MAKAMSLILHSDLNSFYASVELLHRPAMRGKPLVVGGDEEARHGIVLAKNEQAKAFHVKTGMTLREARQFCPNLQIVPANMPLYLRFSRLAREIYADYTDAIEPFGIDECWLDLGPLPIEKGEAIANEIRTRMQRELGVTVSIGVSFNKIFAKLGSDLRKPNATSVISRDNYKEVAWSLPASDLLYVGSATNKKLYDHCIYTIGDIAKQTPKYLRSFLHKPGELLWSWANGYDSSPVAKAGDESPIKTVGNSITTRRDLICDLDVQMTFMFLAESVAARMRENGFEANTIIIQIRDNKLNSFTRQIALVQPTTIASEMVEAAMVLFRRNHRWPTPLRSIGIRGANLTIARPELQYSFFPGEQQRIKRAALEQTIDTIRYRYGYLAVRRALTLLDNDLTGIDAKNEHTVHPVAYRW